jgi:hypothetical protein
MKSSLLISAYKWQDANELVVKIVLSQTHLVNEILTADDVSGSDTRQVIEKFQEQSTTLILYFLQVSTGFRKSKILNEASAETEADCIIQIDGYCIMHSKFIQDFIQDAELGIYPCELVNILPELVVAVCRNKLEKFNFFSKEIKNRWRILPAPFLTRSYNPHDGMSRKFKGCKISFSRNDFIAINGNSGIMA